MRIGASTRSWQFARDRRSLQHIMKTASDIGLDGVEISFGDIEPEEGEDLLALKRRALHLGLDLYALEVHQNFVKPLKEQRQRQIDYVRRCLDAAYKIGATALTISSGRWETVDYDELVRRDGVEPPISGFTEESAFAWVVDSINKCIPMAEECGVVMALENSLGIASTADRLLEVVEAVKSDWLRVTMDTGNFLHDVYEHLRRIAQATVLVHAKVYLGGGPWYTPEIDYEKVATILRDANYRGYVSIEHEGKEPPEMAVQKAFELLGTKLGIH